MIDLPSFALTVGHSFATSPPCGSMFFILMEVFARFVEEPSSTFMPTPIRKLGGGISAT